MISTEKRTVLPNFTLPFAWIINCAKGTDIRQFGKRICHPLASLFPFGRFFLKHGYMHAERPISGGPLFSDPTNTSLFKNPFVRSKHDNGDTEWLICGTSLTRRHSQKFLRCITVKLCGEGEQQPTNGGARSATRVGSTEVPYALRPQQRRVMLCSRF